jgi:hypothetical protein
MYQIEEKTTKKNWKKVGVEIYPKGYTSLSKDK